MKINGECAGEINESGRGGKGWVEGTGALDRFYIGWSGRSKAVM